MLLMNRLPLNSYRFRPRAPKVPITTEMIVAAMLLSNGVKALLRRREKAAAR